MESKVVTKSILSIVIVLMFFIGQAEASQLYRVSGNVTFLRVNALGSGYGPAQDFIDGEVIIKLNTHPDSAYGFQLRNTGERPMREAMFTLLKEAYKNNWQISIDYWQEQGKKNSVIYRLWVSK